MLYPDSDQRERGAMQRVHGTSAGVHLLARKTREYRAPS